MKSSLTISLISLLLTLSAQAATFQGTIERFQGFFVETPNRSYDYLAFLTSDGRRIKVPEELNGAYLEKKGHQVIIKAKSIQPLFCTDMSQACLSGVFEQIEKITIVPANTIRPFPDSPMTCLAYWEGFVFEDGQCVLRGASGCSNPFPYKTLEACKEDNL